MTISASAVKELREKTNIGFMDCKKALKATCGNLDEAIIYLRKSGLMKAQTKAGRATKEGRIEVALCPDNSAAVFLEVNCETDFVAKNENFISFTQSLMKHALAKKPGDKDEFLSQKFLLDESQTVDEALKAQIAKIGENLIIRRIEIHVASSPQSVMQYYIHMGSKLAVIVHASFIGGEPSSIDEAKKILKDVAMHVAASAPLYVRPDDVPQDIIDKEKEIYLSQVDPKKPENIREKIIQGKIAKYANDICLVSQPFVKAPELTVQKYLDEQKGSLGCSIKIEKFSRFQLGD